jgi:hypothetical protein
MNAPIVVDPDFVGPPAPAKPTPFMDFWLFMLTHAAFGRAAVVPYRGHKPNLLGSRAAARARGFTSVSNEAAVMAAHKLQADFSAQQAAVPA